MLGVKWLYFLSFQILLRGANGDELKKVKHVIQYGVFAAYHLALETSFLADEGASLPELPLNSPITVALPDKASSIDRSISTIPGYSVPANEKILGPHSSGESRRSNTAPTSDMVSTSTNASIHKTETTFLPASGSSYPMPTLTASFPLIASFRHDVSVSTGSQSSRQESLEKSSVSLKEPSQAKASADNNGQYVMGDCLVANGFGPQQALGQGLVLNNAQNDCSSMVPNQSSSDPSSLRQDGKNINEEQVPSKEEFPPSPSDHQSILVSLSSRCVWKGTVCERSHLFRIKYYGNFDKPLGRFLRDHLFDQVRTLPSPMCVRRVFTCFLF